MTYTIRTAVDEIKALAEIVPTIKNPSDELIALREKELGIVFSSDYKYFLKNTANLFFGTKDVALLHADATTRGELTNVRRDALDAGVPNDWIAICEDNGDFFCLVPSGEVRYWSHDSQAVETWPSLAEWIKKVWIHDRKPSM